MHFILNNTEFFLALMRARNVDEIDLVELELLPKYIALRKQNIAQCQDLENENNQINSKLIPELKKTGKLDDIEKNKKIVNANNEKLSIFYKNIAKLDIKIKNLLDTCPNLPLTDSKSNILIPIGNEEQNKTLFEYGEPQKFNFTPKTHEEICQGLMDFEQTSVISGPRFVILHGKLAKLEQALINFMLDIHTKEHGYEQISTPFLVKEDAMYGVGQLPKFADESYATLNKDYRLIPTAEVPLTNLVAGKILNLNTPPLRYVAATPCFRAEAGSAGRDTKGLIRLHQFIKVELVSITNGDENITDAELERMTNCAKKILELLKLPYRVVLLATADMGFAARKTYDLEVWMPGQNKYREISSCSYCGDFQARRIAAKYKDRDGKNKFVHTFNGSALAIGRTMAAILENFQTQDADFEMPEILKKYYF